MDVRFSFLSLGVAFSGAGAFSGLSCTSSCAAGSFANCSSLSGLAPRCFFGCGACQDCPAGTAAASAFASDASACKACGTGQAAASGASACASCAPGRYASDDPTEAGGGLVSQALSRAVSCNACPEGHFASASSTIVCVACGSGTASGAGASNCSACSPGRAPGAGQGLCSDCRAGAYAADAGQGSCADCPGDFHSTAGSRTCDGCLRGFFFLPDTSAAGVDDDDDDEGSSSFGGSCEVCLEGAVCGSNGEGSLEALVLAPGFWRISRASMDVRECPFGSAACPGGDGTGGDDDGNSSSADRRARRRRLAASGNDDDGESDDSSFGEGYCAEGYTGPLCAVCSSGHFLNPDDDTCEACGGGSKEARLVTATAVVALAAALAAAGVLVLRRKGLDRTVEELAAARAAMRKVAAAVCDVVGKTEEAHATAASAEEAAGAAAGAVAKAATDGVTFTRSFERATLESLSTTRTLSTAAAVIKTRTTVATTSTATVTVAVTVKPPTAARRLAASLKTAQVPAKTLASFGQIAANIAFNCNVKFPGFITRILEVVAACNLDFLPALGLRCWASSFDYAEAMVVQAVGPLLLASVLGCGFVAATRASNWHFREVQAARGRMTPSEAAKAAVAAELRLTQGFSNAFLALTFLVSTSISLFLKLPNKGTRIS